MGLRKEGPRPTEIGRRLGFSKNAVIGMPGEPQFGASSDTEFAIGNSRKVRRREVSHLVPTRSDIGTVDRRRRRARWLPI